MLVNHWPRRSSPRQAESPPPVAVPLGPRPPDPGGDAGREAPRAGPTHPRAPRTGQSGPGAPHRRPEVDTRTPASRDTPRRPSRPLCPPMGPRDHLESGRFTAGTWRPGSR